MTGRDAQHGLRVIIDELGASQSGLADSRALLATLDAALQSGKLELFPTLQEGNLRALEGGERAGARRRSMLTSIESRLRSCGSDPTVAAQLQQARAQRQALDDKVEKLPDTAAEFEQRKAAALARVALLAKADFRLGQEIDSLGAQLTAATKWQKDTAAGRVAKAGSHKSEAAQAEAEFVKRIEGDRAVVHELEQERQRIEQALDVARGSVVGAVAGGEGDEQLRADYTKAAQAESAASGGGRRAVAAPDARALEMRIQASIARLTDLRVRVVTVRTSIRARAQSKLTVLRARLDREAKNINGYGQETAEVEGGTKQLLGRITTESFERVGRIFGDIILKADVGVIDTAWAEKRERTDSITALEEKKQKELKSLADEFSEVLKEVE